MPWLSLNSVHICLILSASHKGLHFQPFRILKLNIDGIGIAQNVEKINYFQKGDKLLRPCGVAVPNEEQLSKEQKSAPNVSEKQTLIQCSIVSFLNTGQ